MLKGFLFLFKMKKSAQKGGYFFWSHPNHSKGQRTDSPGKLKKLVVLRRNF